MQRILIVGASSLVGHQLAMRLRERYCVVGTFDQHRPHIDGVPMIRLPLRQDTNWPGLLSLLQPSTVFYCAAERDEKRCQQHPMSALALNAEIPASLARHLEPTGGRLVYFSTAKVFSGETGNYSESDALSPVGHYGHSKARGEELLSQFSNVFTIRLGTLYGLGPVPARSLLNKILKDLWAFEPLPLVEDELRSFQSVEWVAEACERLLVATPDQAGLYHLPSPAKLSHFSFTQGLARTLGLPEVHLNAVSAQEFFKNQPAAQARSQDTSLSGAAFEQTFGIRSPTTAKCLKRLAESLKFGQF